MSDYPKGDWCDVWDGLYWRFIDRNLSFFSSNHRMSMMVGGLGRLEPARRERIFGAAERFIERVTISPTEFAESGEMHTTKA
jgi:deoxyribodipyrimidine photolyase-related protein